MPMSTGIAFDRRQIANTLNDLRSKPDNQESGPGTGIWEPDPLPNGGRRGLQAPE